MFKIKAKYLVFAFLLLICFLQSLIDIPYIRSIQQILKVFVILIMIISTGRNLAIIKNNSFMVCLLLFSFAIGISSMASAYFSMVGAVLLVLLTALYFYGESANGNIKDWDISIFFILYIVIALYRFYLSLSNDLERFGSLEGLGGDNTGYVLLMGLPACFLFRKKTWALFIVFIISLCVLWCRKRGAIISLVLPLILFLNYFVKQIKNGKIFSVLFILIISYAITEVIISNRELLFSRFEEGGSSGRDIIYSIVYNGWAESTNFLNLLFGYGFYSTMDLTASKIGVALYAHSDIFEILYDFGFIGLLLYLYAFFILIYKIQKIKPYDDILYYSALSSFLIIVPKIIVSGLFFDIDSHILMLFIGFTLGNFEYKKHSYEYDYCLADRMESNKI